MLTVGSLFSGIGGLDLGLEQAGMRIVWQAETDPFCRKILARRFPGIHCYLDVRDMRTAEAVDVLAGGFPCQTVSSAARGRNVHPWLWPDFARLVRLLRPRYVLVENVVGHLAQGRRFGDILGDLAAMGFDATWGVVSASEVGAPHHRPRVWLVGYSDCDSQSDSTIHAEAPRLPELHDPIRRWPDPPRGLGMADGIPHRMDRLRTLGNAVVPAVAQALGQMIVEHDANAA